jgi:hypothetical protein
LKEKDELIVKLINDKENIQARALMQRFVKESYSGIASRKEFQRTVGQLRESAEAHKQDRKRVLAEVDAKERAKREKASAVFREQHLNNIIGQEASLWLKVETLINTKQPQNYERALNILIDLKDIDRRTKKGDFAPKLANLRMSHARKSRLIGRLDYMGIR